MNKKSIFKDGANKNLTHPRNQNGITLIALVITIIVLLILAGVAISMLSGENGILNQAAKAKTESDEKSIMEELQLAVLSARTEGLGKVNYTVLNEEFAKLGFVRGDQTDGKYENDVLKLPEIIGIDGKHYAISENGKVTPTNWYYKKDENGRKTIVTDGELELPIGTYINYNAAVKQKDKNGNEAYISYVSPIGTRATKVKASEYKNIKQGNGYIEQTFSCDAITNGWRVLGIDEETGEIQIISADVLYATGKTYFALSGVTGYQYGVIELNNISAIFGHGEGATGARSVNIDDINKITGYNPYSIGIYDPEQIQGGRGEYGDEVTFSWTETINQVQLIGKKIKTSYKDSGFQTYGFNWYDLSTKSWKNSMQGESNSTMIAKLILNSYMYYPYSLTTSFSIKGAQKGLSNTSKEYKTIFRDSNDTPKSYWLASQCVSQKMFNLRIIEATNTTDRIYWRYLYWMNGSYTGRGNGVRPVVTLKSNIKLQYDSTNSRYDIIE